MEGEINTLGYERIKQGELTTAIEIFMWNVKLFPESSNAHDSLAEAYMKNGRNDFAVKHYKKSLALNPNNTNAEKMLEKLK